MYDKLDFIQSKYEELSMKVSDPAVIADQSKWQGYAKEIGEIEPIVHKYVEYKKVVESIADDKEILVKNIERIIRENDSTYLRPEYFRAL